jgi:hypothetical protein
MYSAIQRQSQQHSHTILIGISISAFSDTFYIHISPNSVLYPQSNSKQPWIRLIGYVMSTRGAPLSPATKSYTMADPGYVAVPSEGCYDLKPTSGRGSDSQFAAVSSADAGETNTLKNTDLLERSYYFRNQPVHCLHYSNPLCGPQPLSTGGNHIAFYLQSALPRHLPAQPTARASSSSAKISAPLWPPLNPPLRPQPKCAGSDATELVCYSQIRTSQLATQTHSDQTRSTWYIWG